MKRTPWFPCSVQPVRKGFYECVYGGDSKTRMPIDVFYWNGRVWQDKFKFRIPFGNQLAFKEKDVWRGLVKEVK